MVILYCSSLVTQKKINLFSFFFVLSRCTFERSPFLFTAMDEKGHKRERANKVHNGKRRQVVSGVLLTEEFSELQELSFDALGEQYPSLCPFLLHNKAGKARIDWNDQDAVRCLNAAILKVHFGISITLPPAFLCPTVSSRLNYIRWLEKVIGETPPSGTITGIDMYFRFSQHAFYSYFHAYAHVRSFAFIPFHCVYTTYVQNVSVDINEQRSKQKTLIIHAILIPLKAVQVHLVSTLFWEPN